MKKVLLFLTICTLIFTACSDDNSQPTDSLIGTWSLHQRFENGIEENLTDCVKKSTTTLNENGSYNCD